MEIQSLRLLHSKKVNNVSVMLSDAKFGLKLKALLLLSTASVSN